MSSSSENSTYRRTLGRRKNLCSTPLEEKPHSSSSCSIQISTINTNSSSGAKIGRYASQLVAKVRKRNRRKRAKEKRVARVNKRRKFISASNSDSNWETRSEEFVYGGASPRDGSVKSVISTAEKYDLFREPEQVRDAHHIPDCNLESPLFRPRSRQFFTQRKDSLEQVEVDLLPFKNLSSTIFRDVQADDDDSERGAVFTTHKGEIKTYPAAPKKIKRIYPKKWEKWLVQTKVPTAYADLLWKEFVNENFDKISKYLTRRSNESQSFESSVSSPIVNNDSTRNIGRKNTEHNNTEGRTRNGRGAKMAKMVKSKPTERYVACGYWDPSVKKWIREFDEYKFAEEVDEEFRKGANGQGISYTDFRKKRNEEKQTNHANSLNKIISDRNGNIPSFKQATNHSATCFYKSSSRINTSRLRLPAKNQTRRDSEVRTDKICTFNANPEKTKPAFPPDILERVFDESVTKQRGNKIFYKTYERVSGKVRNTSPDIFVEAQKVEENWRIGGSRLSNLKDRAYSAQTLLLKDIASDGSKSDATEILEKQPRGAVKTCEQQNVIKRKLNSTLPLPSKKPKIISEKILSHVQFVKTNKNWYVL